MNALITILIIIVAYVLLRGLKVVKEYERGVVLTLGKYAGTREPGLTWIFVLFGIQEMIVVDIRINSTEIPQQEVITKDNVPVGINAVVYFHVLNADKAILKIRNYSSAITQYAQAALRDVIGGVELDTLLSEREKIAEEMKKNVDTATTEWGINITDIRIQDIELPADMKRVMAKQAESERERRAKVIQSQGEYEAAEQLAQAAQRLSSMPGGLSLRTLETIEKINPDPSKTVIFALPIEFLQGIQSLADWMKNKK